jgi:hypothetical protein
MPKVKARKRGNGSRGSAQKQTSSVMPATTQEEQKPGGRSKSRTVPRSLESQGKQNLVMYAMVALGCWGMAISFVFFTTDPNRYLYGGIAVIMALMWSFTFGLSLRKSQLK